MLLWPLSTTKTFVTDKKTDRQTLRLYDRPGPEGQVGENPNI